jgi:hypothetical protein
LIVFVFDDDYATWMKSRDEDNLDTGSFGTWATMMEGHDITEEWNLNQPEYPLLWRCNPGQDFSTIS